MKTKQQKEPMGYKKAMVDQRGSSDKYIEYPKESASKNKCKHCGRQINWRNQKRQFKRCLDRGLTTEEAAQIMPRHQKCLTLFFSERE